MNKEINEIINNLEQTLGWCDRITTGNLPHKIGNLKQCLVSTIELLKVLNLGWHPASELPVVPEGEDEVEVYCLVRGKGLTILVPMKLHYTISRGFGVSENIEIGWWCYPPKEK